MFSKFEEINIGEKASISRKITEEDIRKFVDMTGDDNPLHVDDKFAATTSYKEVVVHGMLGASFISTIIGTKLPGPGALWISQNLEFLLPVRLNDVLTVIAEVKKKFESERVIELQTTILNQFDQVVLRGVGKVKLLTVTNPDQNVDEIVLPTVALVTGGSGDIGRAICLKLAKDGFKVAVNYFSGESRANDLVRTIEASGGVAVAVKGDVSKKEDVEQMSRQLRGMWGSVDVVVHNASPKIGANIWSELKWDQLTSHLDTQLKGVYNLVQVFGPEMQKRKCGKFIAITSQVIDGEPTPKWTAYAVGKSAMATFCRYMAAELAPSGIQVNCVSPGMVDTRFVGDLPEKSKLILARQNPSRRLCTVDDVAGAVAFLSSQSSNYINGETIRVNGGKVMI
jgi:3-oxoacyl-[acyl-carrier protein] reductase